MGPTHLVTPSPPPTTKGQGNLVVISLLIGLNCVKWLRKLASHSHMAETGWGSVEVCVIVEAFPLSGLVGKEREGGEREREGRERGRGERGGGEREREVRERESEREGGRDGEGGREQSKTWGC